ncbi:DUF2786 domain-containing protein [Fodinicola feengrottensis]|uniref:DUF2786 domain-containing protein n=1 Tax=Fodinicola feengrottensis TaxID=435914 RepID=A0ABN2H461_9ACTN|nr:DUF2786 domain-containing protein [Fodinicola feengrottensis]
MSKQGRRRRVQEDRTSAPGGQPTLSQVVISSLVSAAQDLRAGNEDAPYLTAGVLADRPAHERPAVQRAVAEVTGIYLRNLAVGGWLPEDLVQISNRRLGSGPPASFLTDQLAAFCQGYAQSTLDDRWKDQLAQLEATLWWEPDEPHLGQWIRREGLGLLKTLLMVIELLALLGGLPALPVIVPPPGSGVAGGGRHHAADAKVLGKVRALLAKAESTEFDEEAEALSAKAQELMSRYALTEAMLEFQRGADPRATTHRFWLDDPYATAKSVLVNEVATANRCRTVLHSNLGFVAVLGDPVDVDSTVLLATSLLVQATRALVSAGRHVTRTGQSRTRSFRQAFLLSYANRIGERLTAANEATAADVSSAGDLLPVLASKALAVENLIAQDYPALESKPIKVRNEAGWGAGRAAADAAQLGLDRKSMRQ